MIKILMIEDDADFASLLIQYMNRHDIIITNYEDPFVGLSAPVGQYDLLLLDLTLPGMDGAEVCQEIMRKHCIPIIVSSARHDIADKATCLGLGADDYMSKPYDPEEMRIRIKTVLRRYRSTKTLPKNNSRILMDEASGCVIIDGHKLTLTPGEFSLMRLMSKEPGTTIDKRIMMYEQTNFIFGSYESLTVTMSRLRKKIGAYAHIKTIRGIGYKLIL